MKNKLHIGGVITSVVAGILLSSTALAHHADKANQSYVGNAGSGNHYITDGSGNCVRTGSWKAGHPGAATGSVAPCRLRRSLSDVVGFRQAPG